MSKLDLANVYGLSFKDEHGATNFVIDSDVLRKDPDVIVRKQFYETINKLNSTDEYTSYGIVMYAMPSLTDPKLPINIMKKKLLDDPTMTFTEYLVMPIDSSHPTIETFLHTAEDILKSTTLIRCSCDLDSETLPQGSLVKIHFDNSRKENATIVEKYSKIPPLNTDKPSKKEKPAAAPYQAKPCDSSNQQISPKADATAQSTPDDSVNQSAQPAPQFSSAACSGPQIVTAAAPAANIVAAKSGDFSKLVSKYFTIEQLRRTDHQMKQNIPNEREIEFLTQLANSILDPIVDKLGRDYVRLNCAFRNKLTNDAIKGSPTSQHLYGQAADLTIVASTNRQFLEKCEAIYADAALQPLFGQIIVESNGNNSAWLHVAMINPANGWTAKGTRGGLQMHLSKISDYKGYPRYNRDAVLTSYQKLGWNLGLV